MHEQAATSTELARLLDGRLEGDPPAPIDGIAALGAAGPHEVAVVLGSRHLDAARRSGAGLLVAEPRLELGERPVLRVASARRALADLLERFHPRIRRAAGIAPGAFVSPLACLAEGVHVAPGAVIEDEAVLAAGVEVHAHAVVGRGARVGPDSVLYPKVVLYPGTRVGARVEIHAGSVIGHPGFGFYREADGRQRRIPQTGWVEIGDDVEIGALCAIDAATFGATRVRRGTKIDNLVQIGHNSEIGEDCCIVAQVGVSGSVEIGARSLLLGQVGVADHSVLEPETVVGAQSGVVGRLHAGEWIGYPAIPAPQARRVYGLLSRLPELARELRRLRREVAELERRVAGGDGCAAVEIGAPAGDTETR